LQTNTFKFWNLFFIQQTNAERQIQSLEDEEFRWDLYVTADTCGGAYNQWQVSNSDVGDKELALPVIRYENPNDVSIDKSLKGASGGHCKCEWIDEPQCRA
jgi:hypothetical protein